MDEREDRVLVVDDVGMTDVYASWLDGRYDVSRATSGTEALETIDDVAVHLDRRMSNRSDGEVLAERRAAGYDCRVAVVTGDRPGVDVRAAFASLGEAGDD